MGSVKLQPGESRMTVYPLYEDIVANRTIFKGNLPFYISIHNVRKTPLHHHDVVELTFVLEGRGVEIINGTRHQLQDGASSFLLPHHMHQIECESGMSVTKYCCMFDINMLLGSSYESELSSLLFQIGSSIPPFVNFSPPQAERMRSILEILHEEYNHLDSVGRSSLIRVKLTEAMLLFVRASQQVAAPTIPVEPTDNKINFWKVLQYLHVHYREKLTLESVSRQFRVSTPYISRLFKEHVGQSFLTYLHGLRIKSAASLLVSTEMSMADIAAEVGFESYRTFLRVFREIRGQTPSEYRHALDPI
jgi:AraC-like DNA-binding protein/mannose-6-phosphate isomerase-like protein (cupin superfamily)